MSLSLRVLRRKLLGSRVSSTGLRNKVADTNRIMYTFDFTSEQVRKNEGSFCPKGIQEPEP